VNPDDGLACACGTGDARRAAVVAGDPIPLVRVQKHRPLFPRVIEGELQFIRAGHHAEATLGVGMVEGVRRSCGP